MVQIFLLDQVPFLLKIGERAYVGLGSGNSGLLNDFWEYDPIRDSWAPIANFPGESRYDATGFQLNGFGFVGGGMVNGKYGGREPISDLWKYDPQLDSWVYVTDFRESIYNRVVYEIQDISLPNGEQVAEGVFIYQTDTCDFRTYPDSSCYSSLSIIYWDGEGEKLELQNLCQNQVLAPAEVGFNFGNELYFIQDLRPDGSRFWKLNWSSNNCFGELEYDTFQKDSHEKENWMGSRENTVSFVIGSLAFVGLGRIQPSGAVIEFYDDFKVYNNTSHSWNDFIPAMFKGRSTT